MSNFYQIKYGYTEGGDFLLKNTNYIGFYNVYNDGSVYTGQYRDAKSYQLELYDNYSSTYNASFYFRDRVFLDNLSLPYDANDVRFDTNEIVNIASINTKLNYIQSNLIYIYSKLFFGDTDVPYNYTNVACISAKSTKFIWHKTRNGSETSPFTLDFMPFSTNKILSTYKQMDNLKRFVNIPFSDGTGSSILAISDTHLVGLTSNKNYTSIDIVLYENVIDNNSTEFCQNLSDLTFDGKYLYVTDSQINSGGQIFKYDVKSYYTNDKAYEFKRFLIKPLGGLGKRNNKNKFNGCDIITSNEKYIFVNDAGNKVIKIYDSNFVYKKSIRYPLTYSTKDMRWRKMNNSLYVLYITDDKKYRLREYADDFSVNSYKEYEFEDSLYKESDFEFYRMCFSQVDSNVFYLISKTNIFKKFFSNPRKTFATFIREKYGQDPTIAWKFQASKWNATKQLWSWGNNQKKFNLKDIYILNYNDGSDTLFVLSESQIFLFKEKTLFNSILRNSKLPFYRNTDVNLTINENVQGLVFNKELFKIYSNIVELKNHLSGRFYFKYDKYGDLRFNNYISLLDNEINQLNVLINFDTKINNNEIISPQVMNRIFEKIIQLEQLLFSYTEPFIENYRSIPNEDDIFYID
jgi:hypothetical protein